MNDFFDELEAWNSPKVLYSHTDSILISKDLKPKLEDYLGKDLGHLECEDIATAVILRSNAYYLKYTNGKSKSCVGGLVKKIADELTEEDFIRIYQDDHPTTFEWKGVKLVENQVKEVTFKTSLH